MKTTVEQRRKIAKWVIGILFFAFVIWWSMLVGGCRSTVTPARVEASSIAFDGNEQTAGVLFTADTTYLTERKKAEYDALVALYGRGTADYPVVPAVDPQAGLVRVAGASVGFPAQTWVWRIDREHLSWMITFREWQRTGRPPR